MSSGHGPRWSGGVAFVYTPRAPTAGVLYEVVRGHLNAFLATL